MSTTSAPLPPTLPASKELLPALLDLLPMGVIYYTPILDAAGVVADFKFEYLNPAGRRQLHMAAPTTATFLEQFTEAGPTGAWAFHVDLWAAPEGATNDYSVSYHADGYDNFFRLNGRRLAQGLLITFTDTADQPRTPAEEALREAQARERAARYNADAQRQHLHTLISQVPAIIASLYGPEHLVELANAGYQQLFGQRQLQGLTLRAAAPELAGQGFFELLDEVYRTGTTHYGHEVPAHIDRQQSGQLESFFFNFTYQAIRDAADDITGVLIFATDVTEQVLARQQVQNLNEELAAINEELAAINEELAATNEELQATNEEYQQSNTALLRAQDFAEQLANDLDTRVQRRTHEAQAAHAEAERQRRRLEQLFMHAPAAICILGGPDLVYELVNPPYQQIFPGRALQGRPIAEALPEIVGLEVHDTFLQVYRTGVTTEAQAMLIPIVHPETGLLEDRYFKYIQQARLDEQGQPDGVLVFAFEVTQQVQALQASEATSQRLQLLTDALPVLISYVDPGQRYQFVNAAHRTWFGHAPAALLGRPLRSVVGDVAYANAQPYIERALAGEALTFEARMPYREDFVKHIHANFIPDIRDGKVHGFYSLATDITDQVNARERVQELNDELQATNDELLDSNTRLQHTNVDLDTFVYTASHDLKAPISNIEGLLHALHEQLPTTTRQDPEVAHLLSLMHDSVARFQHTIGHLTDISKLQKSQTEPAEEVDLAAFLDALRLDLAPALAAAQGSLSVALGSVRTLRFSPKNLRSILYNLLSNAIKYHQPGRPAQVLLRAHRTPGHLIIEVQDNGLGLSPEQQASLFIMFRRLHTHVEGSGVGLYMVKRIAENAGGSVRVRSEVGVGSTFTVILPEG